MTWQEAATGLEDENEACCSDLRDHQPGVIEFDLGLGSTYLKGSSSSASSLSRTQSTSICNPPSDSDPPDGRCHVRAPPAPGIILMMTDFGLKLWQFIKLSVTVVRGSNLNLHGLSLQGNSIIVLIAKISSGCLIIPWMN